MMSIVRELTKVHKLELDSQPVAKDLSAYHHRMVAAAAPTSGTRMNVTSPSAIGGNWYGVLIGDSDVLPDTAGKMAELQIGGTAEIQAGAAITAGSEVMIADTTGRVITATAGSGYLTVGVAKESAGEINHLISVRLYKRYIA